MELLYNELIGEIFYNLDITQVIQCRNIDTHYYNYLY